MYSVEQMLILAFQIILTRDAFEKILLLKFWKTSGQASVAKKIFNDSW